MQTAAAEIKGLGTGFFASLKQAQVQIKGLAKDFEEAGKKIQAVGRTLTTALTLPIVGAGVGILKQAGDFERAMNSFAVNAAVAGKAFEDAEKKAQALGQASVFTSTEAAQGMTELAKVGLDFKTIMGGAADAMVNLAAANNTGLASAATVVGDVINQFKLSASQLPGIVDSITGATIESKLSFDDYRLAIGQAGGAAGALGVTFQDFNAVLAATASSFSSGSDAGTSFKTFLTRLVPQSDQAAAAMEKLGLKFFDAKGNMLTMSQVAQVLQDKLGKLSQEDLTDNVKTIFGVDAMRTAIALMKQGSKGIDEMSAKLKNTDSAEIAATRVKGLWGEIDQLKSALENLSIAIGASGFLDFVTQIVIKLTEWTQAVAKLSPETLRLGTIIGGVAASIGPLLLGLGLLTRGFGIALEGAGLLLGGLVRLRAALLFISANPIVVAIGLIATGIGLWALKADAATAALQRHEGLVEGVKEAYGRAGNAVKNMTDEIRNGLIIQQRAALQDLVPAFETEIKRLRDLAAAPAKENPFSQALRDFAAGGSLEAYLAAVKKIGAANPDLNAAADAFVHLTDKATGLQEKIKPSADFLDLLTGKITDAAFQAKQAGAGFQALGTDAKTGAATASAAVDETAKKVENLHTITVTTFGPNGPVKQLFDVAANGAATAREGVSLLASKMTDAEFEAARAAGTLGNLGKSAAGAGADVSTAGDDITNSINKIAPAAQDAGTAITSGLGNIDASGAAQAAEALLLPFQALPGQFGTILGGLRSLLQGGFANLASIVTSLAGQIQSAIAQILASLRAAAAAAQALRAQAAGSSSSDTGGSHGGFAGGGSVRGPGGPKTDSILAYLSNGEFVIQAAMVKRLGVDFFNSLNNGVPSLNSLRGFSLGGVVESFNRSLAIPRFATGGLAPALASASPGGSKMVHLKLDFGLGPNDVFDIIAADNSGLTKLQRFAVQSGLLSTGRKPRRG
ncbi:MULTISPECIES: phage tail tape measure protein [Mesorhizobium]|uniref:phage tail tape measure protein n=1 Tax=Mesorhizobium TaxID=68287 RepID=UPI00145A0134|nr:MULTISPECIES: phage tail tape measure protein [Mesorhizobium]